MGTRILQAYGVGQPTIPVFPPPVLAKRAPSDTTDTSYPPGQPWVDQSSPSAPVLYTWDGVAWETGGNSPATTTTYGTVLLTDNNEPVATKFYADNLAIAGAPVATETTAGIGQLATDVEAVARTASTGALALFITPTNLTPVMASPGPIGSTLASTAVFTDLTATGTISIASAAPITIDVTGAGNDLTLSSDAGRVIINGEEAADNAITLLSAAGGIDADAALQINIATSETDADSFVISSSGGLDMTATGAAGKDIDIVCTSGSVNLTAGESIATSMVFTNNGMDISTAGAAGRDIDIVNTGGSINITATENNAGAIIISTNGGTSERITLNAIQGTGADSINLASTVGGITLTSALASADAINLTASDAAGGIDVDAGTGGIAVDSTGAIVVTSTANSAASLFFHANGGVTETIRLHADQGTAATSLDLLSDVGGITLRAGLATADAINITATAGGGGIDIDSGTAGIIADTTGAISLDAAAASNLTVTGAFALDVITTLGKLSLQSGQSAADSIEIKSLIGGIDILAVGAAAGEDIDIIATGSSVNIAATENDAGALTIGTNGGTSEKITVTAAQGTNAASIGLISTAGGITLTAGLATADAININTSNAGGGIDIDGGTAGVIVDTTGAISLDSAAASNFTVTGAFDLTLNSTAGSVNLTAGEVAADSMVLTNNGMDIVITGAATRDFDLTNTGGSVNITATENVTDAIVITASGAASGMTLDAGTLGLTIGTGVKMPVTSRATAGGTYTILGTDYFIDTDTTGGALQINLPAVPVTGMVFVVYDGAGQAAIGGNVTISGNGNNIAAGGTSNATKLINTAYESYILTWNGTIWCGQNIV